MATKIYKLTDLKYQTRNKTQWGENISNTADGIGDLCSAGWLHAYTDPSLAAFLHPMHVDYGDSGVLWEAYGSGQRKDDNGLKVGFTKITTKKIIQMAKPTPPQRVAFGILCAMQVCDNIDFNIWANDWLNGKNRRDVDTARFIYAAAYAAAAYDAAAYAAANAADVAAYAAYAADAAAGYAAANATHAAIYAFYGDNTAYAAAESAKNAADAAVNVENVTLNLKKMALEALKY